MLWRREQLRSLLMVRQDMSVKWALIFALAVLGLVRPLLSIAGVYEALGSGPLGPILVTVLVAAIWVGVVVGTRAPNPLATLVLADATYGVFAILLQQFIWNLLLGGAPDGPFFRTHAGEVLDKHPGDQRDLGRALGASGDASLAPAALASIAPRLRKPPRTLDLRAIG
jgi:hypothetical protein